MAIVNPLFHNEQELLSVVTSPPFPLSLEGEGIEKEKRGEAPLKHPHD
jgi:hypothetical protein